MKQQVQLEFAKANTFYWQARSRGRVMARETTVSLDSSTPFYCRLHREYHQNGPCPELVQISRETGLPMSVVIKGG